MNRTRATLTCNITIFILAVVMTSISPLLPEMAKAYKLSVAQSGMIFTVQFVGFLIFIAIMGIILDRVGKPFVLKLSLFCFSLALLLLPSIHMINAVFISVFIIGGITGVLEGVSNSLVTDLNPEKTNYYINLAQVFFGIGALTGPIALGIMLSNKIDWKTCYYILGILVLILAVIVSFLKLPNKIESQGITWNGLKDILLDKKFLVIALCMAFYTGSEIGVWGWMGTFLKEDLTFSVAKCGVAVAVFWMAITIGRFFCGVLIKRFEVKKLVIILSSLSAITTLLSGFVHNEIMIWILITLIGFSFSSLWPFIAAYGKEHSKAMSGIVFSFLIGSGGLGATCIPAIMGILHDKIGGSASMVFPAILLFLIAIIFTSFKSTQIN